MSRITVALRVQLACVFAPMQVVGRLIYLLEADGQRFVSVSRPTVFDRKGEVIELRREIEIGSTVRVQSAERVMRAIQIFDGNLINPFVGI